MSVVLRAAVVTDAVGAGLAHRQILRSRHPQATADFWEQHTEQKLVDFWHQEITNQTLGTRISVATQARRVVGIALLKPLGEDDHNTGRPARGSGIEFLGVLDNLPETDVEQRLLDFILPPDQPAQTWVVRDDSQIRQFYRRNGFTADGLILEDAVRGCELARMVR